MFVMVWFGLVWFGLVWFGLGVLLVFCRHTHKNKKQKSVCCIQKKMMATILDRGREGTGKPIYQM